MSVHACKTSRGTRYEVRLRAPDGRQYKKRFRTRRDAEAFEARELADRSRGVWLDPRDGQRSFGDVASQWLATNPAKRSSTRARDESILRLHLLPEFGERPLASIRPRDVQALVNAWNEKNKPRTVRRQYDVLRAVFGSAVDEDCLARTPCRNVKLPEVLPLERPFLNGDQLATLGQEVGDAYAPMLYLGTVLGLRWGEIAGLRVGRIDFDACTVTIAEQLTRGEHGREVLGQPKSKAGRRRCSVPQPLIAMLETHLARRGLTSGDADAFVFVSPKGLPLRYDRWRRRVWLPAVERAGLPGLTFHDLRRANATALVLDGVDVKTAQTRLGHSDPRLTLAVYAMATTEGDLAASQRLGRRFLDTARDTRCAAEAPRTERDDEDVSALSL